MPVPDRILKDHKLRSTPARHEILNIFLSNDFALSFGDIEKAVTKDSDRVTVYRTLRTFLDNGLIHKVLDDEGTLKYALCRDACSAENHRHQHVHFKCLTCGHTSCLEIDVPNVRLPEGYKANEVNVLIQGTCPSCQGR